MTTRSGLAPNSVLGRRFTCSLVLGLRLLGPEMSAAQGQGQSPGLGPPKVARVVSEEPHGVVLRLDAPLPAWTEGSSYVYPKVEGFGLVQETGRPALPVRIERIAIPPGSVPRLTVLHVDRETPRAGVVGPLQPWVPILPGSTDAVAFNEEDAS